MGKRVKAQGTTGPETPSGTGAPEHQEDAHLACGHEVQPGPGRGLSAPRFQCSLPTGEAARLQLR